MVNSDENEFLRVVVNKRLLCESNETTPNIVAAKIDEREREKHFVVLSLNKKF